MFFKTFFFFKGSVVKRHGPRGRNMAFFTIGQTKHFVFARVAIASQGCNVFVFYGCHGPLPPALLLLDSLLNKHCIDVVQVSFPEER